MKSIALIALFLASVAAHASDVRVYGRTYTNSCGYFSNVAGDFRISYVNTKLSRGSRVKLELGWAGSAPNMPGERGRIESDGRELEMTASVPGIWSADVSRVLANRSSPTRFDTLQFTLVVQPAGSRMIRESYAVKFGSAALPPCVTDELPPFRPMAVSIVESP